MYNRKSKSSPKASSSGATNLAEPGSEAKAQTDEKAKERTETPETKTVNEEKEGNKAAENPRIQLEKQSHHTSRRPASAHPPKRRVLVSTPISKPISKKRCSE